MTAIENVRVSQRAKDQLIKLKRSTGIPHWNVLCRWGFCLSLAEESVPPEMDIPLDSNVEMTWRIFGGRRADLYMALLKERLVGDGLPLRPETITRQFCLHLHRGISYLADGGKVRGIDDLLSLVVAPNECRTDVRGLFSDPTPGAAEERVAAAPPM